MYIVYNIYMHVCICMYVCMKLLYEYKSTELTRNSPSDLVGIWVYMSIWAHEWSVWVYMSVWVDMSVCMYMYVYMYVCMYVCYMLLVLIRIDTMPKGCCKNITNSQTVYSQTNIRTHAHPHTHTHTHTYTYIHTLIYTYTYKKGMVL